MNLQLSNLIQPRTLGLGNSQYWERRINPEEIKKFLESKEERDIVEGLTLLIAALSKGTNLQHLFPNIAILIAKQNPEIKKMIYICLGHYAELEQTTALLAINILEKDLTNPNQLVRAHALRTISNVRVKMITRLLITAVEGGTKDTSAYVRKTAAHAILKLWSLDPSQKEVLTECIDRLLCDKEYSVFGSAAAAFNEVCPDNYEIIHKVYKKLCTSLLDIDEWGQQHVLSLLTRYVRAHFVDPDIPVEPEKKEGEGEEGEEEEEDEFISEFEKGNKLDLDHRLVLDCCLPLLKSRSPGVVMCVVSLYQYCAPQNEKHKVVKALIRFIRDSREIQYCILNYIHSIALVDPSLFRPFLIDFFITGGECSFSRHMKIDILTAIADESNIDRILKEFKFYVLQDDETFVAKTIQAIGKCAITLPESLERCISQLMSLLSSKRELVVSESVVVLKQLLQMPRKEGVSYDSVIKQLARLFSKVTSPKAKASIIWVVGEYVDVIREYAPDILRQLAKEFATEPNDVKMQIMNLAVKLLLTNPEQTKELAHYIFFMAKFDTNYDIRDKARLIRFLVPQTNENPNVLQKLAKSLLLSTKPSPQLNDTELSKNKHTFGSLSHLLRQTLPGYTPLPDWALVTSDPTLRTRVILNPINSEPSSPLKEPQRGSDKNLDAFFQNEGEEFYEDEEEYYDEEGEYEEGEYEEGEYEEGEYEEGEYDYDENYDDSFTPK